MEVKTIWARLVPKDQKEVLVEDGVKSRGGL